MKANNLPDYPRITLAALSEFKVDLESARRFERRLYPRLLGGTALAFGGFAASVALHHFGVMGDAILTIGMVGSFVLGLAISVWTHHRMMRAIPRGYSGQTMAPFIVQDSDATDHYELAYVDKTSGTYFRRLYVERGG
jgi:hypothetical protein